MVKKVGLVAAAICLVGLLYFVYVRRFAAVPVPAAGEVVSGVITGSPEQAVADTPSGTTAPSGTEVTATMASTESDFGTAAEKTVEDLIDPKADELENVRLNAQLALRAEMLRRQAVIKVLPPYSDKKDGLKEKLRKEFGDITAEKIDNLVARAKELEALFWAAGDFDVAASFDSIYEARAALDLCLEADPTNEPALRRMISVVSAGWPYFLGREDMRRPDPVMHERSFEGNRALYGPLMTLWNEHVSKKTEPTLEDLAVANDLLIIAPPTEEYAKLRETFNTEHPGGSKEEWFETVKQWRKDAVLPIVDWLLDACRRKGPDWDFYAEKFTRARTEIDERGYGQGVFQFWFDPREPHETSLRYCGRCSSSFRGPEERAEQQQPFHVLMKNMPRR